MPPVQVLSRSAARLRHYHGQHALTWVLEGLPEPSSDGQREAANDRDVGVTVHATEQEEAEELQLDEFFASSNGDIWRECALV